MVSAGNLEWGSLAYMKWIEILCLECVWHFGCYRQEENISTIPICFMFASMYKYDTSQIILWITPLVYIYTKLSLPSDCGDIPVTRVTIHYLEVSNRQSARGRILPMYLFRFSCVHFSCYTRHNASKYFSGNVLLIKARSIVHSTKVPCQ